MRGNSPTPWSVRAISSDTSRSGRRPVTSCPRQINEPESGVTNPQMTLNRVVLPAPLGPITPSTSPLETSTETLSRAVIPPNETVTSRTAKPTSPGCSLDTTAGTLHDAKPSRNGDMHDSAFLIVIRTATRRLPTRSSEPATRYAGPSALLAQLVEHFHGKEGVVGSSPTEGSFESPGVARFWGMASLDWSPYLSGWRSSTRTRISACWSSRRWRSSKLTGRRIMRTQVMSFLLGTDPPPA